MLVPLPLFLGLTIEVPPAFTAVEKATAEAAPVMTGFHVVTRR